MLNRNNLGYGSAYPSGTLAFPTDIPRVHSAGYSCCYLGMAGKNVVSFFTQESHGHVARPIPPLLGGN
jgi:hypothetical protein